MLRYPRGSTISSLEVVFWSYSQMCALNVNWNGLWMHKTAKVIIQYPNIYIYIFPNYLTQGQVPVATFLNSHKNDTAPPPQDRVGSGRPSRVSCHLPWRWDKLIFHLNARCSEHWCKGYYPECPGGLANSATCCNRPHAGVLQRNESVEKKKHPKYFSLNVLPYKR